ncbi:MAG: hypothetical protein HUJ51_04905 [Eggerthellaceae bacterium]|nr:hypothetical protein [Eggerthellaceae bacterium]
MINDAILQGVRYFIVGTGGSALTTDALPYSKLSVISLKTRKARGACFRARGGSCISLQF